MEGPWGPSSLGASPGARASWWKARSLPGGCSLAPHQSWSSGHLPAVTSGPLHMRSHVCEVNTGNSYFPETRLRSQSGP